MTLQHTWTFPLPRTHTGPLLGNGTFGVMAWGEGNQLRLTLGRADWWDRRSGRPWTEAMAYTRIRALLEANDESGIRALFSEAPKAPGLPSRPSVLPVGRIDLVLPTPLTLDTATLDFETARLTIRLKTPSGPAGEMILDVAPDAPLLRVALDPAAPAPTVELVPAWRFVGEHLASISFTPPQIGPDGWVQTTPADETLTVAVRRAAGEIRVAAVLDGRPEAALAADPSSGSSWWHNYWMRVPVIDVPNERLRFLYGYGMYKFAGLTAPQGTAATLQGPWIEEYQMPPWSSDYHFNINVQMCYWPAYSAGLVEHLDPLFRMIERWLPRLRENARLFAGVDDGYLLPHAVDDRGGIIGAFWTGTIDHACTAWVGKMMFDAWRHTGDDAFLRRLVFPFLAGTMRVYEAMMDRAPDGSLVLPVSVSPEYRGAAMNAWGRNASFQLAACHWLAEALETAAARLGEPVRPFWGEVRARLPLASLHGTGPKEQIALWDGLILEESHRHHSHLAGISPFDTIDLDDPAWAARIAASADTWVHRGMGLWSGWCMPWAAMLNSRLGNPDAAELILEIWERVFTNEGHGTLHDVAFNGFSLIGRKGYMHTRAGEIMQMDAGMAVTAAILDGLAHARRGILHVFAGAPARWKRCGFRGIHVGDGFSVSAEREDGRVTRLSVHSARGGVLRLRNPWQDGRARILEFPFRTGETRELA
jgi:alpha-L-fucosidase 2